MLLLEGNVRLSRNVGGVKQSAFALPGALLGGAAFLTATHACDSMIAATPCLVYAMGESELKTLLTHAPAAYLQVLLAASKVRLPAVAWGL